MKKEEAIQRTEKEFLDIFKTLCYSRSSWQVWADVMTAIACGLSNAVDRTPDRYEKREKEYKECVERLGSVELTAKLLAVIVMALERDPEQDFLGKLYMALELGNHWKGQFFTPYSISRLMSETTIDHDRVKEQIEKQGYVSVCDPACGAGATLVAAANRFRRLGINYQNQVLFAGQDIDRVVAMMCYIQLTLLGCPGYVVVANTLTNPMVGDALVPHPQQGQEYWFTPFYFSQIWDSRRHMAVLKTLFGNLVPDSKPKSINLRGGFLFEFEKGGKEIVV